MFHSLKNYDAHVITQELRKFDFKINIVPNGLNKYMSFSVDNNLFFIHKFQFCKFLIT